MFTREKTVDVTMEITDEELMEYLFEKTQADCENFILDLCDYYELEFSLGLITRLAAQAEKKVF